jgi:hypothetical protein
VKPAGISGLKRGNEYLKDKIMSMQQTVRTRTLETCIEEYMNLRRLTNLEVT